MLIEYRCRTLRRILFRAPVHGNLSAHDATEMAANLAFRRPIRAEEEFDAFLFQHLETLS
jgi:hypothetical protein